MDLKQYFDDGMGFGVLSTADGDGRVNAAVYARPHCSEDGTLAFIMTERLTYRNLVSNPQAAYLFRRDASPGENPYQGVRLYLRKVGEDNDPDRIAALRRRSYGDARNGQHLVLFSVEEILPLVGAGDVNSANR